jgi:hypothetical protein
VNLDMYALLALVSLLIAGGSFYWYTQSGDQKIYFIITIVFGILTIVFGGLFLSGRVNKTEDIHITE